MRNGAQFKILQCLKLDRKNREELRILSGCGSDEFEIAFEACKLPSQKFINHCDDNHWEITEAGLRFLNRGLPQENSSQRKQEVKDVIDDIFGQISVPRWIKLDIKRRQGQEKFRSDLMRYYNRRCIVTDCNAFDTLEAAHIIPYADRRETIETMDKSNGLLLRADIHTLFDLALIGINPSANTIYISAKIMRTEYACFNNQPLKYEPKYANVDSLKKRWDDFLKREP